MNCEIVPNIYTQIVYDCILQHGELTQQTQNDCLIRCGQYALKKVDWSWLQHRIAIENTVMQNATVHTDDSSGNNSEHQSEPET